MKAPDPKARVGVTRVTKRGEWHTVEGVVEGKKVQAHIPAPSIEGKSRAEADALIRRTLYGVSRLPDSPREDRE